MNSLEVLLSVFQDGEYISKNVIASRIRDSPYPIRSIDLVAYLGALISNNPTCFNRKQGSFRVALYSRTPIGDSLLTNNVLDEIILTHLPFNKYVGFRGILSRTRISKDKLKSRLLSLVQEGRLTKRTNYEKEKEAHYLKLSTEPVLVVSAPVPVKPVPVVRIIPTRKPRVHKLPKIPPPPEKMVFPIHRRKKCPS